MVQGDFSKALKHHLLSLKLSEEINDKESIAKVYNNIGNIAMAQGNYNEALTNYLTSLKISRQINNLPGMGSSFNNIGNIYGVQGIYPEALKNYYASREIALRTNNKQQIAYAYSNIGKIFSLQKNHKEALKNIAASQEINEEIGDKRGIVLGNLNFGELYMRLNNLAEAGIHFKKALDLASDIGQKEGMISSYLGLMEIDSIRGDYKSAYDYSRRHSALREEIVNELSEKEISRLKIQYESDNKDQQIKNQDIQNTLLRSRFYYGIAVSLLVIGMIALLFYLRNRRKKREYDLTLARLELILLKSQLNPHFISNSLSAIKSFIDRQPEQASQFLSKFARLIRSVLEQSEQSFITLEEELKTAELYMQIESLRIDKSFDYHIELDPSIDPKELMVPPLILQPTIENAIWHGLAPKKEKGHIIIRIKPADKLLKITIEDNGDGEKPALPGEYINPLERKSFGLTITKKRIQMLGKEMQQEGYYRLNFFPDHTVAEIAFPVNFH
jgi:tetratricopeptide (TPR) repeat protein